jgi:hypothetical protein
LVKAKLLRRTIRKLADVLADVLEPTKDVLKRRRRPEVLLLETELFADCSCSSVACSLRKRGSLTSGVIVRIENRRDRSRAVRAFDRALVVPRVKALEVEPALRLALPEAEVVRVLRVVTRDHHVIGDREHLLATGPDSLSVRIALRVAVEANVVRDVGSRELPRVRAVEPWVRCLELRAVRSNELLEDAVLVAKAVAPERELLRRRAVEVACRKTTEATVAETGVTFLSKKVLKVEAELFNTFGELALEVEVEHSVVERTAHEELERKVVRPLGLLPVVVQLRRVPVDLYFIRYGSSGKQGQTHNEIIANGKGGRLVRAELVEVVCLPSERSLNVVHDGFGDRRDI